MAEPINFLKETLDNIRKGSAEEEEDLESVEQEIEKIRKRAKELLESDGDIISNIERIESEIDNLESELEEAEESLVEEQKDPNHLPNRPGVDYEVLNNIQRVGCGIYDNHLVKVEKELKNQIEIINRLNQRKSSLEKLLNRIENRKQNILDLLDEVTYVNDKVIGKTDNSDNVYNHGDSVGLGPNKKYEDISANID